jgi:hypothetical protein
MSASQSNNQTFPKSTKTEFNNSKGKSHNIKTPDEDGFVEYTSKHTIKRQKRIQKRERRIKQQKFWMDYENSYIQNMINKLENTQKLYSQFCIQNNKEENFHEMMSFMDILGGGTGQFICIADESFFPGQQQEQQQQ